MVQFQSDLTKLDDELTNYSAWMYSIEDVCKKRICLEALSTMPEMDDKLAINHSKNVNLLMSHSISKYIRHFLVKDNAQATYDSIQSYRPKNSEQCVRILK